MTQQNQAAPDVAGWATTSRTITHDVLAALGLPQDLVQTEPGRAVRLVGEQLAERAADPQLQTEQDRIFNSQVIMGFTAEFLISVHGARWDWMIDASSPLGGRWVVTDFVHPMGQETAPVDVPGLAHEAAASGDPSLVDVINRAERLSMIRVFR
ncbi:hypothetical protein OU787_16585 [Kitasatospora sp. YST-16]|uniref:hypothetical protein n=1 Tax=Kitasatospora sp. YST-16 TaxID=2998080 RepID=UPI0022841689|nr:hypothetical protein [Kitasatospora sp. YST-16]WAL72980.1 hypothetical protein OU787_16585 [Kitasatospora sp. YST-16]WNW39029.1 hypothetical protein RKE32_16540 [Streptomyces sp. Li-HN-5-13]